ncbi:MAG: hypothetical protein WDZ40_02955 [Candidatus Spechtbacterales bacterium]
MDNFEDFDLKNVKFDFKNFKEGGVSWSTRFLLTFWPKKGIIKLTRELGLNPDQMNKAESLFRNTKRIDIIPSQTVQRGFQIILDSSTALYFYQDGDRFIYDGAEVGEYEKGDVTIFDHIR